ncbi:MAG: nucleotidyl transferase AbiEii/AbiGii toxin family protein [Bacteroidales bacterium]|jgi:hypothetical protein|nr:nucleotidyl transferase AbiEii/AbiGii toxin family protein [Bacteroidales bacterium]MDD3130458.1 nucleotidyl transferase AbiEii/AbiGii toxin family protein [Bacteroidales bacterium]MDY0335577.1 nucleotidyl transferase AbiEii/AbiGii toxin family protein [Bacteroidales bacterium]NLO50779.1 nucleotidyl transferase AbiEii/AbiGii toxin family protein [Bacteroidales bacterium]
MLHTETVDGATLELIRQLQADPVLEGFVLVGGTALSLQIGHRISIDIYFFTRNDFDAQQLLQHLEQKYQFREQYRHINTLKGIVNGVFVDFITHNYHMIKPNEHIEKITMASRPDIAAMKVNAIAGNGTRVKDFVDIYFLLKEFSFSEIISFYKLKYNGRNDFHAIKSLTYFDDVNEAEWPRMVLEKDLTLKKLKETLISKMSLL